jgi:hypothetical protein
MPDMNKEKTCCICGKKFTGWGNDPCPVKQEGVCCDECNNSVVLAARLAGVRLA